MTVEQPEMTKAVKSTMTESALITQRNADTVTFGDLYSRKSSVHTRWFKQLPFERNTGLQSLIREDYVDKDASKDHRRTERSKDKSEKKSKDSKKGKDHKTKKGKSKSRRSNSESSNSSRSRSRDQSKASRSNKKILPYLGDTHSIEYLRKLRLDREKKERERSLSLIHSTLGKLP